VSALRTPDHPAARLYLGHVMHMRLIPRRHRFRYRVFSLLVDLDRIDAVCAASHILRHNRNGVLSIHDRDHGPRDGSALRPWVDARMAEAGMERPARVELLAFPRMWGYVFNPLSVYYCTDADDRLTALIYEVKNTFGEQIAYVRPAGPEQGGAYRQAQVKEMYVSPFIGMDQTYRFDLNRPDERLALRIRQAGPEGETLIATLSGTARPVSDRALMAAVAGHPLMTLKVMAAIHWEALRLWLKGVRTPRTAEVRDAAA
jgi:DUF1365 family protein